MPKASDLPSGQSIYSPRVQLFSSATLLQWNVKAAQKAYYIATENATLMNPTNVFEGFEADMFYIQNDTTAKEFLFDSMYGPVDNLPLVPTALNAICYMKWEFHDGMMYNTIFKQF